MLQRIKQSKYIKNAAILLGDNVIKMAVSFIMSIFIARSFGPSKFGQINYVLALISILQVFVIFGSDSIILKDLGLNLCPEGIIIKTVEMLRTGFAFITYVIGFLIFYFFLDRSLVNLYIILGLELFCYIFHVYKNWFQIKSLNKYVVLASQASFIFITIAKIIFLFFFESLWIYACFLLLSLIIEDFVLIKCFRKCKNKANKGFDFLYAKQLLKASIPLLLNGFAIVIYMQVDKIMIGKMLTSTEVGVYSVAVTISEIAYFFPMVIRNAFYPKVVESKKNEQDYTKVIEKIGQFNVLICLLWALLCTFVMPFLISRIYGDKYAAAGRIVQIHSWAGLFVGIGIASSDYVILEGKQKFLLNATSSAAILNVLLNYVLIKSMGMNGAAFATLLSQAFSCYFFYALLKEKTFFIQRTKCFFCHKLICTKKEIS